MMKKFLLASFIFGFLFWIDGMFGVYARAQTIDTLSFFLADDENIELIDFAGTTPISQKTIGKAKFVVKWRLPRSHEYYTWDNDYIYLLYDRTCCGDNPVGYQGTDSYEFTEFPNKGGRWMKRYMQVGESITVDKPGGLVWRRVDCSVYSNANLHYTNTIESYNPSYTISNDLGVDEVIVLRGDSEEIPATEKFYFSKKWGWIKWQYYLDNQLQAEVAWTKMTNNTPVTPQPQCMNFPSPSVSPTPSPSPTPTANPCPGGDLGNINCDSSGLINETDLSILLGFWAPYGPGPTPSAGQRSADLNGDGKVDEIDLSRLLSHWKTS